MFENLDLDFKGDGLSGILDLITGIISGGIGVSLIGFIKSLKNTFNGVSDIIENVSGIFEGLGGVLEGYQTKLKAYALIKIAAAIAILAGSFVVLSTIKSEKLYDSVMAMGAMFAMLTGAMAIITKAGTGFKGAIQASIAVKSMTSMATAILILSFALKQVSKLDLDELGVGLLGIASLMGIMVASVKELGSGDKSVIEGATQMIIFAAAIKILASVCEDLSYLGWEELGKGLAGILGIATVLVASAKIISMGKNEDVIKGALQMVLFASAIKIMASVCEDLGKLSWEEIGRGLAATAGILAEVLIFTKRSGSAEHVMSTGLALIAIAAAMKIFASAVADMGSMSWGEIGRGLTVMAVSLTAVTLALRYMPTDMTGKVFGLIAVSAALLVISSVMSKLGGLGWDEIARGLVALGGALGILAIGLHAMNGTLDGSAALLVAVVSLGLFVPILKTLGSMEWSSIVKGLLSIAATFTILGIAGYLLGPMVPVIMSLAKSIAVIGASVLVFGIGLTAIGAGLTAIAAGIASLSLFLASIPSLVAAFISGIFIGIADGIVALCKIITKGAPAIGEALKAVVLTLCDVLVECLPTIVTTIFKLIFSVIDSLAEYTPKIADALFNFLVGVIDSLGNNMPRLVKSVVNLLGKLLEGVIDALSVINPDSMIKGIIGIGLMAGVMAALAAVSSLIPAAMVGVLGMGLVVTELAIVLAAIGALAQIPGLTWLVGEGGKLMQAIGTSIGQFIGGIIGGIAQGATSALPQIASDLATFMTNLQPFLDGASSIDDSVVSGVYNIVGVMLAITAANVLEGLTSWLSGGSSITKFATELPILGAGLKGFSDSVAGIVPENITAAASAAKALAEMTSIIPNEGGIVSWFTGENSISKFGSELPALGAGLRGFSDSVAGIVPENIIGAANAAKALAEMTAIIPNEGGMVSWFTGDNSLSKFAGDIVLLGNGLKGFSDSVVGVVPENITAAANAAKAIADMTTIIPNEGGIASWFSGDNSISKFAEEMVALGHGLKGFSDAITGVVPENIISAANAAKAIAEMTAIIPNQGGIVSWFAGESSLSKFATDMVALGYGLKGFSDAITGVVPENIMAAANAARSIAEMTSYIPNEGGVVSWFTGETSLSKFAGDMILLGMGLKGFSDAITGVVPEEVLAGANAAKTLAEMTSYIPNEGGVVSWFTGDSSLSKFAGELPKLGGGLKGFSDSIAGIDPEAVQKAAQAAKALAEMTAVIPTEGGIKAWFTGETSISKFADQLPSLGAGLKGFSQSLDGMNPDNVTAAANAAKALGQMTETIPDDTGKVIDFGNNLITFGSSMKTYFANTSAISADSISATNGAIEAVQKASTLNAGNIADVAKSINDAGKAIRNLAKVPANSTSEFTKALRELGETSVDALIDGFANGESEMKKAGTKSMDAFVKGIKDTIKKAVSACESAVKECASAIGDASNKFTSAGKSLVEGFASGISTNTFKAEASARAMAKAAAKAAEEALDINSPSKVFRAIGTSVPEGFAMGIDKLSRLVIKSSEDMAGGAVDGVRSSIARISDLVNTDIESHPTIRPVLDLSDIQNGASAISSLLGANSLIGVTANLGAIGSMMAKRNQNGVNAELISTINKLRGDLGRVGNTTYNVGDITYDDGSTVSTAVRDLVRAAKIERRI